MVYGVVVDYLAPYKRRDHIKGLARAYQKGASFTSITFCPPIFLFDHSSRALCSVVAGSWDYAGHLPVSSLTLQLACAHKLRLYILA